MILKWDLQNRNDLELHNIVDIWLWISVNSEVRVLKHVLMGELLLLISQMVNWFNLVFQEQEA